MSKLALKLRLSSKLVRNIEGSLFIAPWVIGFLVFMAFPLGYSLYMSFKRVRILATGLEIRHAGLEHYRNILLADGGLLYNNLLPFLRQSMIMIPIILVFSLMIAIMLNQKFHGRFVFRAIFFLPVIFATSQVVTEFMSQEQASLGFLDRYNFADMVVNALPATWATPIVRVMDSFILVLWYSGVQILIFLAGRQTISAQVYEAARIDGASPWEIFWKITLPAMTPFILLNLIYTVVDLFTFPTNPILSQVNTSNYGQSSALAWIYFTIILLFLGAAFWIFNRVVKAAEKTR